MNAKRIAILGVTGAGAVFSLSDIKSFLLKSFTFFKGEIGVTPVQAGVENANYIIENDGKKYILRLYKPAHSLKGPRNQESIELELLFMRKAEEAGLPVPRVITNHQGAPLHIASIDGKNHYLILFEFILGNSPKKITPAIAHKMARIVSHLFEIGSQFKDREVFENNIVGRAFKTYEKLSSTQEVNETLSSLYQTLREEYAEIQKKNLSKGLVHGDIKLENLIFSEDESLAAVLDFDDYRYSYLLEEAVMAMMHNLHSVEENIIRSGNYNTFLNGIGNQELKEEINESLLFFLKARFLYDMLKYTIAKKDSLVKELWEDKEIKRHILPNIQNV